MVEERRVLVRDRGDEVGQSGLVAGPENDGAGDGRVGAHGAEIASRVRQPRCGSDDPRRAGRRARAGGRESAANADEDGDGKHRAPRAEPQTA